MTEDVTTAAIEAARTMGLEFDVVSYGRVNSVEEAAARRGVEVGQVIKTLVVRVSEGDHVLVLVPGDRSIAWPKLRAFLGVSRLSMPDAEQAREVTGYERGTITPFATREPMRVIADAAIAECDLVSIGGGDHGIAINIAPSSLIEAFDASVEDVTER